MNILHAYPQHILKKTSKSEPAIILSNKVGSFAVLQDTPSSRYGGFFWYDDKSKKMFKIIEQIKPLNAKNPTEIVNEFYKARVKTNDSECSYFVPTNAPALVFEQKKDADVKVVLDVKEAYDNREWGRQYVVSEEQNSLVIKFIKKTDHKEDTSHDQEEYALHVAVVGHQSAQLTKHWEQHHYNQDQQRNSAPFSRYVFSAAILKGKIIVCAVAWNKEDAIREAKKTLKNKTTLQQKEHKALMALKKQPRMRQVLSSFLSSDAKMAFLCALSSLDRLVAHTSHELFAGLPWFFQPWSRDSLISAHALSSIHPTITKNIIEKSIEGLQSDGTIPSLLNKQSIPSADALGWLCKRLEQQHFETSDRVKLNKKITQAVESLLASNGKDMLWRTQSQQTWMDTSIGGGRLGARIEIQAGLLCALNAATEITGNGKYALREKQLRQKVRNSFWNSPILRDGSEDPTIRPNIFIAAYLYPNLLTQQEWEVGIQNALKALWLPWGGLATIDKSHPLFKAEHTGQNPESYHHGDSWYWINNLAALVMYRINKQKFKPYIDKILQASTKEILLSGAVGCHAELSSAKELRSQGCLSQAWSAAMFVELCTEITSN